MNSSRKHIRIIILCCFFFVPICGLIHAQDWLVLKSDNMIGYELISQTSTIWPISIDSFETSIIQQRWRIKEKDDFYNALPYIFGSPTGEIIGDASWVAVDGSAVYFQKGNVGIKIFKPINPSPDDQNRMMNISNKVLLNIEEHDLLNLKTN